MTERPWDAFLTEADHAVLAKGRFGRRMGFGRRPAVLVIDAQRYMVGAEGEDAAWPSSCGAIGRAALAEIVRLTRAAQAAAVPCFFTRFELDPDGRDIGIYARKRDLLQSQHWCLTGTPGAELAPELTPHARDIVLVKKKPSAFHGTPLLGYLLDRGVDTVIVTGGATSNCVQATVFDAASYNLRAIVPQEAVFDRIPLSHAVALFDMDRQFADVLPSTEVLSWLATLRDGVAPGA
ncbi:cysteine hydrolase family protein [Falsiroseomonas oryzae]|uniref:cysteine hydrolase family protein n=1 Tax=Falsiroseomonas oryzae TaxID=2766473 RepID=UPI0022EA1621|nr:isochorismatase family protein [Roseomonas sp. MO-31]